MSRGLIFLLLCLLSFSAKAFCFDEAGAKHRIDPVLLEAIAKTESSLNPRAINRNRNGSIDLGLMQINSSHLKSLRRQGVTKSQLKKDACLNVNVGAGILADSIKRHGRNWKAVGAYNSGVPEIQQRYIGKVWANYQSLISRSKQERKA